VLLSKIGEIQKILNKKRSPQHRKKLSMSGLVSVTLAEENQHRDSEQTCVCRISLTLSRGAVAAVHEAHKAAFSGRLSVNGASEKLYEGLVYSKPDSHSPSISASKSSNDGSFALLEFISSRMSARK
jgi:hypothetical protein